MELALKGMPRRSFLDALGITVVLLFTLRTIDVQGLCGFGICLPVPPTVGTGASVQAIVIRLHH